MNTRFRALVVSSLLWAFLSTSCSAQAATVVSRIYDGDTVTLSTGEKVRLLQMDTPELSPSECYAKEAKMALVKLLAASFTTAFSLASVIISFNIFE